jgi:hypothetical protein
MLRFVNESVPTSLAEDEHELFVYLLLQLFRVGLLNLFQQLLHGVLALLIGVQDHTIKIGKDFNLDHIDQASVWKFCPTSHALPFFNHPSYSDLKLILNWIIHPNPFPAFDAPSYKSPISLHCAISSRALFDKNCFFLLPFTLAVAGGKRPKLTFIG